MCPRGALIPNYVYYVYFSELCYFLALLDYVSRVHGMGSLSVVRVAIFSQPIEQIPFKFQVWLLLDNTPGVFGIFEKKKAFSNF